jgi:hypothetical protein
MTIKRGWDAIRKKLGWQMRKGEARWRVESRKEIKEP